VEGGGHGVRKCRRAKARLSGEGEGEAPPPPPAAVPAAHRRGPPHLERVEAERCVLHHDGGADRLRRQPALLAADLLGLALSELCARGEGGRSGAATAIAGHAGAPSVAEEHGVGCVLSRRAGPRLSGPPRRGCPPPVPPHLQLRQVYLHRVHRERQLLAGLQDGNHLEGGKGARASSAARRRRRGARARTSRRGTPPGPAAPRPPAWAPRRPRARWRPSPTSSSFFLLPVAKWIVAGVGCCGCGGALPAPRASPAAAAMPRAAAGRDRREPSAKGAASGPPRRQQARAGASSMRRRGRGGLARRDLRVRGGGKGAAWTWGMSPAPPGGSGGRRGGGVTGAQSALRGWARGPHSHSQGLFVAPNASQRASAIKQGHAPRWGAGAPRTVGSRERRCAPPAARRPPPAVRRPPPRPTPPQPPPPAPSHSSPHNFAPCATPDPLSSTSPRSLPPACWPPWQRGCCPLRHAAF
jgi:hypothetical protein